MVTTDPRVSRALDLLEEAHILEGRNPGRRLQALVARGNPDFKSAFDRINFCRGEARRLCAQVHGGRWI